MAKHTGSGPAGPYDHDAAILRGTFPELLEELLRLGLIDAGQRQRFEQGLAAAAGGSRAAESPQGLRRDVAVPTTAAPASPHARSDEAAERAVKAGLVTRQGAGRYRIGAGPETVHWGYLSGAVDPVLRVQPGDTVTVETVSHEGLMADQGAPAEFFARFGIPRAQVLEDAVAIYARVQHSGAGPHVVSGPILVAGAEPGDVLAVHIVEAAPRVPYGVNATRTGKGALPDEFTLNRSVVIPFDLDKGIARFAAGIDIPLRPFFGIMATGPARSLGKISSVPPGPYGGNLDINELTAGSTLYLPVHVPGALFLVGDGHAAQGDGEVDLTAIETSLTGTFRLDLLKRRFLSLPRAETPTHWITVGLHEDLNEAMRIAVRETVKFLVGEKGLSAPDAYALASVAVDFQVSQVVDQVKGIHAMIPKSIFKG
jgi:acetamidase/formamidase